MIDLLGTTSFEHEGGQFPGDGIVRSIPTFRRAEMQAQSTSDERYYVRGDCGVAIDLAHSDIDGHRRERLHRTVSSQAPKARDQLARAEGSISPRLTSTSTTECNRRAIDEMTWRDQGISEVGVSSAECYAVLAEVWRFCFSVTDRRPISVTDGIEFSAPSWSAHSNRRSFTDSSR